jgi:hypothetical protein
MTVLQQRPIKVLLRPQSNVPGIRFASTPAPKPQMKVSPMFRVQTTDEFVQAASELLGQDNVRLPVENGISAAA